MSADVEDLGPELLAAMRDAHRRGIGWVKLLRIAQHKNGALVVTRVDPSLVVVLEDPTVTIDHLAALILMVPCTHCDAVPDEPCTTPAGRRTTFHQPRSVPVYRGWVLGQRDGLVDAVRRLTGDRDTPGDELLASIEARWA